MRLAEALEAVRLHAPLVHCITNKVTANACANVILAAGGSPTMAGDPREAAEVTAVSRALVLNLGAVERLPAMLLSGKRANELGIPVVLDPVAAGVTTLRRESVETLMGEVRFAVIRGNASEIRALALGVGGGRGVDAAAEDLVTQDTLPQTLELAQRLSRRTGAAVVVSGPLDVVVLGEARAVLENGCPAMARVTGCGCMLSALTGAFCGALPEEPFRAAVAAAAAMGVAGQRGWQRVRSRGGGLGSFPAALLDELGEFHENQWEEWVRYALE